uniref:Uncharacterized protein n=1 Tax=Arundo donax TaxID=35708 RepID=A0A0A8YZM9_ARUDO
MLLTDYMVTQEYYIRQPGRLDLSSRKYVIYSSHFCVFACKFLM